MDKNRRLLLALVIALVVVLLVALFIRYSISPMSDTIRTVKELKAEMNDALICPKIEEGGVVRVYVSGGMFSIADTLYSIGPKGLGEGYDYQSINLIDMICNLDPGQQAELSALCQAYDVPDYGIVGEIKKMGWECYCPVRDGLTMATVLAAIAQCTYAQITQPYDAGNAGIRKWQDSMFNPKNIQQKTNDFFKAMGWASTGNLQMDQIIFARAKMNAAVGTNVGANDLYNMYSTCNACIMNYNGIEPDAGALAEIGQLGARGVPSVILKGTFTGDFGGISNPMPIMSTTASNVMIPTLTGPKGALPFLKAKVDRFKNRDKSDPLTNGNYNHEIPLPPLQIFWSDLGSKSYFLKHKNKSIQTDSRGYTDFKNDYTQFWNDNVINAVGTAGLVQVGKAMADNLEALLSSYKYRNINLYWS